MRSAWIGRWWLAYDDKGRGLFVDRKVWPRRWCIAIGVGFGVIGIGRLQ